MTPWSDDLHVRRDGITIRAIWVAVALSMLLHVAFLAKWKLPLRFPGDTTGERSSIPLNVELVPRAPRIVPPSPPVIRAPAPAPAPRASPPPSPPPRAAARAPVPPPVIAMKEPAPKAPAAVTPPVVAPARPADGDLSSYIEARRRARGDAPPSERSSPPAPPQAEDDNQRANRIAAANLAAGPKTFGYDPNRSGGVFRIQSMSLDYAEVMFYGWNKDARRNTPQLIEVRRGSISDIRLAVVKRMIAVIRDYEQEDFIWESRTLNRYLTLSARPRDNAGLEEFMMREFFADTRPAR